MRKFLTIMATVLCGLPFVVRAQAACPQVWNNVTFDWQEECEVIADIHRTKETGGEVSDNSPDERRIAVTRVCREVCGGLDFVIEPKDPREVLYRIKGGRVCLAPGEGVRESPNPGAALAELSEETQKRCKKVIADALEKKRGR